MSNLYDISFGGRLSTTKGAKDLWKKFHWYIDFVCGQSIPRPDTISATPSDLVLRWVTNKWHMSVWVDSRGIRWVCWKANTWEEINSGMYKYGQLWAGFRLRKLVKKLRKYDGHAK
jgi:hypothetical protein